MKASDLIKLLSLLIALHGDLEVVRYSEDWGQCDVEKVVLTAKQDEFLVM